jgi:hypothetical protein
MLGLCAEFGLVNTFIDALRQVVATPHCVTSAHAHFLAQLVFSAGKDPAVQPLLDALDPLPLLALMLNLTDATHAENVVDAIRFLATPGKQAADRSGRPGWIASERAEQIQLPQRLWSLAKKTDNLSLRAECVTLIARIYRSSVLPPEYLGLVDELKEIIKSRAAQGRALRNAFYGLRGVASDRRCLDRMFRDNFLMEIHPFFLFASLLLLFFIMCFLCRSLFLSLPPAVTATRRCSRL